jgi:serine/threonine-protein kinase
VETAREGRERRRLQRAGQRALDTLWPVLDRKALLREAGNELNVGVAHGWGGLLYATLRWCEVTGARVAARVKRRLDDLAGIAEPFGRGVRWPWLVHGVPFAARELYAPGWCNGSAGLVPLWLLAHRLTGTRRYTDLALGSALHAWESDVDAGPHLCCGRSGQAYAMLAMYQATKSADWLWRARRLAQLALDARPLWNDGQGARRPESLYFGDVGIALLLAELEYPDEAKMPMM